MKKAILVTLVVLLLGGAAFGGWYYYQNKRDGADSGEFAYVAKVKMLNGSTVGTANRYAGVVEPQNTVKVNLDKNRVVSEVKVQVGDEVKAGDLLFRYDLSSIENDLKEKELEYDRLLTEHTSIEDSISTYETALDKAETSEEELQLTIEIETAKLNLKKNEFNQESKKLEVEGLKSAMKNPEVKSEIDGVIQKIDTSKINSDDNSGLSMDSSDDLFGSSSSSSDAAAFITILSTGAYRVKGTINEQNIGDITPQAPMIVRSRVDESLTWKGTMKGIDMDSSSNSDNSSAFSFGMSNSSDSQTSSSVYPFYVELETSEGLLLGQHVYIENDIGQENVKDGLWLQEYYIVDAETESPYVWAVDEKGLLEQRSVVLGVFDGMLAQYEILSGLSENDMIAYPSDTLKPGMATQEGDETQVLNGIEDNVAADDDMLYDDMLYDEDLEYMNDILGTDDMDSMDDGVFEGIVLDDDMGDIDSGMMEEIDMEPLPMDGFVDGDFNMDSDVQMYDMDDWGSADNTIIDEPMN